MGRTFYFQLQPEGLGTPTVECLASYVHRLAAFHGVTLYQLLAHLDTWWGQRGGSRLMPLSRCCETGRMNGYNRDIEVIVRALEAATGLGVLRACTLLALKNVCAGNMVGATKLSRAWCPICYSEAEALGTPIYDQLIWQIHGIERCSTHGTALAQKCWNCGGLQRNSTSKTLLSRCELCDIPLYKQPIKGRLPQPDLYDLKHVASLVAFTSSNPEFAFELGQFTKFSSYMIGRHTRKKLIAHLGDTFHKRAHHIKPKLTSLMEISTYFDTSMVAILSSPGDAAAQADLGFDPIVHERASRPRYKNAEREMRTLKCLEDALSGTPPFPTVSTVCLIAGVSSGYMIHNFPRLVSQLIEARKRCLSHEKRKKANRVMRLLRNE